MNVRTVAIVGAGLAGARTAETLRAEGFDGDVVLVGEEPIAPYERPALSKEYLAGTRDEQSLLLRPPSFWDERGIELLLGERVLRIDAPAGVLQTERGLERPFDAVVVATGARPRRLPQRLPRGVHELRTLADARALRAELAPGIRLVVVGGGLVGAEVASTASGLGARVMLIEAASAPLVRALGRDAGLLLAERWRSHGIDVRLGAPLDSLREGEEGRIDAVVLADGSVVPADVVLIGIGVEPARELLDDRAGTNLFTAGDVTGAGHWTAAALDGAAAARRILRLPVPAAQPAYVWSDQFGLRLQVVGRPADGAAAEVEGSDDSFAVRYRGRDGVVHAAVFANRPADAAELRRSLLDDRLALAA